MDAIQEFEQYCALHPDPWLQAMQAIQNQPLQSFVPLPALQATQATQQYTPPAPQAKKEEVRKPRPKPLYQTIVEDDTESTMESTTKHGSSMAVNKSTLSTIPRLHAARSSGNSAACPSNLVASFFGDFLTSFFGSASLLGYIRCMEGMEATGQG